MVRVNVVAEGPTEESFLNNVLGPVLWPHQVFLTPIILGVPGHKGGRVNYARVRKDVLLRLKQDTTAYCSTMVDFYGLGDGFPGTATRPNAASIVKVQMIEDAMKEDIVNAIPEYRPDLRFLPYIQLHEFEGLLFSEPAAFASGIGKRNLTGQFQAIREEFDSPEDINDGPNTAPSKRVLRAYPGYQKVLEGTIAAMAVGIERMRLECPHFREWLVRLETLSPL